MAVPELDPDPVKEDDSEEEAVRVAVVDTVGADVGERVPETDDVVPAVPDCVVVHEGVTV